MAGYQVSRQPLARQRDTPTIIVLEVHLLDDLAHAEHIRGSADDVHAHPRITRVQGRERSRGIDRVADAVNRSLDIGPRSNDGAKHHQAEGEQGQGGDAATEPEHLSVRDNDDCQVLEDGVDRHGEELQGLGARVNHADEK